MQVTERRAGETEPEARTDAPPLDEPDLAVSATRGLEARRSADHEAWAASGLDALERHLVDFLAREKADALREAVAARAGDRLAEAVLQLRLQVRSLEMPLDRLQERLELFERKIDEARRQRTVAGDLLGGDRRRALEQVDEQSAELGARARTTLETAAREAMRRAAVELLEIPYHAPRSSEVYEIRQRPYWVTRQWESTLRPLPPGALDPLLPRAARRRRVRRRVLAEVESLVVRNVEGLRWPMVQNLQDAFRRFTSSLDRRLRQTIEATRGAMQAALTRRAEHSLSVTPERERLEAAIGELEALRDRLAGAQAAPAGRGFVYAGPAGPASQANQAGGRTTSQGET